MVNQARMPPSEKMHPRKQSLEQGQKKQAPHQTHRQWHSSSPMKTSPHALPSWAKSLQRSSKNLVIALSVSP